MYVCCICRHYSCIITQHITGSKQLLFYIYMYYYSLSETDQYLTALGGTLAEQKWLRVSKQQRALGSLPLVHAGTLLWIKLFQNVCVYKQQYIH